MEIMHHVAQPGPRARALRKMSRKGMNTLAAAVGITGLKVELQGNKTFAAMLDLGNGDLFSITAAEPDEMRLIFSNIVKLGAFAQTDTDTPADDDDMGGL